VKLGRLFPFPNPSYAEAYGGNKESAMKISTNSFLAALALCLGMMFNLTACGTQSYEPSMSVGDGGGDLDAGSTECPPNLPCSECDACPTCSECDGGSCGDADCPTCPDAGECDGGDCPTCSECDGGDTDCGTCPECPDAGGDDDADAGTTDGDAGTTDGDAGTTDGDAGTTDGDAGTTDGDAGTTDGSSDGGPGDTGTDGGSDGGPGDTDTDGSSDGGPGDTSTDSGSDGGPGDIDTDGGSDGGPSDGGLTDGDTPPGCPMGFAFDSTGISCVPAEGITFQVTAPTFTLKIKKAGVPETSETVAMMKTVTFLPSQMPGKLGLMGGYPGTPADVSVILPDNFESLPQDVKDFYSFTMCLDWNGSMNYEPPNWGACVNTNSWGFAGQVIVYLPAHETTPNPGDGDVVDGGDGDVVDGGETDSGPPEPLVCMNGLVLDAMGTHCVPPSSSFTMLNMASVLLFTQGVTNPGAPDMFPLPPGSQNVSFVSSEQPVWFGVNWGDSDPFMFISVNDLPADFDAMPAEYKASYQGLFCPWDGSSFETFVPTNLADCETDVVFDSSSHPTWPGVWWIFPSNGLDGP